MQKSFVSSHPRNFKLMSIYVQDKISSYSAQHTSPHCQNDLTHKVSKWPPATPNINPIENLRLSLIEDGKQSKYHLQTIKTVNFKAEKAE